MTGLLPTIHHHWVVPHILVLAGVLLIIILLIFLKIYMDNRDDEPLSEKKLKRMSEERKNFARAYFEKHNEPISRKIIKHWKSSAVLARRSRRMWHDDVQELVENLTESIIRGPAQKTTFYQLEIMNPSMSAVVSIDRNMAQRILRSLDDADSLSVTVSSGGASLTLHLESHAEKVQQEVRDKIERKLLSEIPLPDVLQR